MYDLGLMGRETKEVTGRRTFLKWLLGGSLVVSLLGLLGAALAFIFPPARRFPLTRVMRVGEAEQLPVGEGELVIFNGRPVWVLHLDKGFVALSALCTHRECLLEWDKERRVLSCPCHMGLFDVEGNVLAGLPPRPLPRYRVAVRGGGIYISSAEERS